jgi:hypothetical protein
MTQSAFVARVIVNLHFFLISKRFLHMSNLAQPTFGAKEMPKENRSNA